MEDHEILRLIQDTLCEIAPDRADHFRGLTLESEVTRLGIDSIATLEMVGRIEDRLIRTFDEHELARVKKLGDLATLIRDGRIAPVRPAAR